MAKKPLPRKPKLADSYFGTYRRLSLRYGLGSTNCEVIRAARKKLTLACRKAADKREERKKFYRIMLYWHEMHVRGEVF